MYTGTEGRGKWDADTARLQQVVMDLDAEVARLTTQLKTLQPPTTHRTLWLGQWWARRAPLTIAPVTSPAPPATHGMSTNTAAAATTAPVTAAERAEAVAFATAALERAVVFQEALARQVKERGSSSPAGARS